MTEVIWTPLYGYFNPKDEYYDAIIRWQRNRYGVQELSRECIGYENGVLGGVLSALNVFCSRGDKVLLNSPTYVGFTAALENSGYNIVLSPLKKDTGDVWRLDYEDMEKKLCDEHIHTAIFCSPHNPCGRVWERRELEKVMELFAKYDVMVVADEIWADIILGEHHHIPAQSVSEDARMRTVAMYALLGAYSDEGEEWVNELCRVLTENIDYAYDYITKNFDGVSVSKAQGTYMLFLDCSEWCKKHHQTIDEVQRAGVEVGVIWQDGRPFHAECGIRMNLALPNAMLREALDRLHKYVFTEN